MVTLSGCAQGFSEFEKGMEGTTSYSFPEEGSKDKLLEKLTKGSFKEPSNMISDTFPLLDVVKGTQGSREAKIYSTQSFSIQELASLVVEKFPPEQESELHNGKKILVYPNEFITFKQSEQDQNVVLMEIASDEFVRNNYSPNFFDGLLALWILDEVLDVDDWGKKRRKACLSGACYGGYSSKKYRSGTSGSFRGSTNRGGGPSSGK